MGRTLHSPPACLTSDPMNTMRILVSVRNLDEALLVAREGADFIDLKDPAAGALGGLEPERITAIVRVLRALPGFRGRISATIGDWPVGAVHDIVARITAVAATGVDDVKVGVSPIGDATALITALRAIEAPVVPVLIADHGVPYALLDRLMTARRYAAVMLDTENKRAGSLLQRLPHDALSNFVTDVRTTGAWAGLAGALRLEDVPALIAIDPDFAGFRSAVCSGDRAQAMDPQRLRALRAAAIATTRDHDT